MQFAKDKCKIRRTEFEGIVIAGYNAGNDLASFANNKKNKIEQVIIGSQGTGYPKEIFFGSVSWQKAGIATYGTAIRVAITLAIVLFSFRGKRHPEPLDQGEFGWDSNNAFACVAAKEWILGTFVVYAE